MGGKVPNHQNILLDKAKNIKNLVTLVDVELDELISLLNDPTILQKELSGRRKEIEEKLQSVVETMIEVKKLSRK